MKIKYDPKELLIEINAVRADLEKDQTFVRVSVENEFGLNARAFLSAKVVRGRVKFELEVCCNNGRRTITSATADWRL
jgi:hypothetical protein